jgi:hypothetical protein
MNTSFVKEADFIEHCDIFHFFVWKFPMGLIPVFIFLVLITLLVFDSLLNN